MGGRFVNFSISESLQTNFLHDYLHVTAMSQKLHGNV